MPIIVAQIADINVAPAMAAIAPYSLSGNVKAYAEIPVKPQSVDADELANKVVAAVRPKSNQTMRKEALRKLLSGHDTWLDQQGEPDPALRNAMGAISKSLKSVFPAGDGMRRLAKPQKTWFDDGRYRGTSYAITPLGERVRNLLKAEGSI
jgi:hypothetical protein